MTPQDEFTLSEKPELAAAVGGLIMSVSQFEGTLLGVLGTQLKKGARTASAIFENVDNIGARLEIVAALARLTPAQPINATFLEREGEIRAALKKRNEIAHSLFGYTEDGEVVLMTGYLSARRGKPRQSSLLIDEIDAHSQNLSNAMVFLTNKMSEIDFTPRHRMKDTPG